jgi:quercetin dioxygenase-like cupin family protein
MISEQLQEQASLYALGALTASEQQDFEAALRSQPELRALVRGLQSASEALARSVPQVAPPPELRARVLRSVGVPAPAPLPFTGPAVDPAFFFVAANDSSGWKELPVRGAFIKLLSADRQHGYAVVLGRLEAGVRYPAHPHTSPEEIFLLTGDLTIAGRRLGPGDFHHCDAGTEHPVNYSDEGCTLLAVLSLDHDLAKFAMA